VLTPVSSKIWHYRCVEHPTNRRELPEVQSQDG
jgi:hypothetical protein